MNLFIKHESKTNRPHVDEMETPNPHWEHEVWPHDVATALLPHGTHAMMGVVWRYVPVHLKLISALALARHIQQ